MDRVKIKAKAREIIKGKLFEIWKPVIIIWGIQILLTMILSVLGINPSDFSKEILPGIEITLVNIIETILLTPLSIGVVVYILNIIRNQEHQVNDIFKQYKNVIVIILVNLISSFLIIVGFAFLVIPGIIISLILAMTSFVLADGSQNIMETLRKSKELMNGYKWNYFLFNLSFIGWFLLGIFTLGLIYIYAFPYMSVANALYYEELKAIKE
jgi:uncharacterized membrane protein